jgi:hypothetical protein
MAVCYFLLWDRAVQSVTKTELGQHQRQRIIAALRQWGPEVDALTRVVVHTPTTATDRYLDDRDGPALTLQCYFSHLAGAEKAASAAGAFVRLLDRDEFSNMMNDSTLQVRHQLFVVRPFALVRPHGAPPIKTRCTYQVAYESASANVDIWLADYLEHHVPLLKMQPGLLEMEVYTRLDWISSLPWQRAAAVQRNKAVFSDAQALSKALHSPVRDALHQHSLNAPALNGRSSHFPMLSETIDFASPKITP